MLHFWKGAQNFGDMLNPWLWNRLIPDLLDEDSDTLFFGIGSILNNTTGGITAQRRLVFGSGVGYGKGLPAVDGTWKFYCVRGPLSAQALKLPEEAAIVDPGALVKDFVPSLPKLHRFAFMPHWTTSSRIGKRLCDDLGIMYIDPLLPVDDVLKLIAQSKLLLAEAMHGAIVADALRVPWIPIRSRATLDFKWRDYCRSLDLEYRPEWMPYLYDLPHHPDPFLRCHRKTLATLAKLRLKKLIRSGNSNLSSEAKLGSLCQRLMERLQAVRSDVQSGEFEVNRAR